jgi:hypothetical protein
MIVKFALGALDLMHTMRHNKCIQRYFAMQGTMLN